jgi:hypothetical protein
VGEDVVHYRGKVDGGKVGKRTPDENEKKNYEQESEETKQHKHVNEKKKIYIYIYVYFIAGNLQYTMYPTFIF